MHKDIATMDVSKAMAALKPTVLDQFQNRLQKKCSKLADGVIQNYPEYNSEWIRCINWGREADGSYYKVMKFNVLNPDTNEYEVKTLKVEELTPAVFSTWIQYEAGMVDPFYGCGKVEDFWDGAYWDALALDCLMQVHFFGEVVYG